MRNFLLAASMYHQCDLYRLCGSVIIYKAKASLHVGIIILTVHVYRTNKRGHSLGSLYEDMAVQ